MIKYFKSFKRLNLTICQRAKLVDGRAFLVSVSKMIVHHSSLALRIVDSCSCVPLTRYHRLHIYTSPTLPGLGQGGSLNTSAGLLVMEQM